MKGLNGTNYNKIYSEIYIAIDLAMYITSIKSLGLPKSSRESFTMLSNKSILTPEVEKKMIKMVGFRNIIIHEYQKVELGVIDYILENGLSDFTKFTGEILKYTKENDKIIIIEK